MMRQLIPALLAAPIALASQTVSSVHDDLLAFPQVRFILFPLPTQLTAPSTK
jgi:protein OS-9